MTEGKENTLVKASETVEIVVETGSLSLLQRKMFNCLYMFARAALLEREMHSVPLPQLTHELSYTSRNYAHLVQALLGLTQTQVRWNYLGPAKKGLGASPLLAQAEVIGAVIYYAFPPKLRTVMHTAQSPAFIELSVQRQLTSNYSQALYELLAASRGIEQDEQLTAVYGLQDLRRLLGVPVSETYLEFKRLNKRILQPAVCEVSEMSPYTVTLITHKQGNSVTAVQFHTGRKQSTVITIAQDMVARLVGIGCTPAQTAKLVASYPQDYLGGNLAYVEAQWQLGKVKRETPVPLLFEALKMDYRPRAVTLPKRAGQTNCQPEARPADKLAAIRQAYHQERRQAVEAELDKLEPERRDALNNGFLFQLQRQPALLPLYRAKGLASPIVLATFHEYLLGSACPFVLVDFPVLGEWLKTHKD